MIAATAIEPCARVRVDVVQNCPEGNAASFKRMSDTLLKLMWTTRRSWRRSRTTSPCNRARSRSSSSFSRLTDRASRRWWTTRSSTPATGTTSASPTRCGTDQPGSSPGDGGIGARSRPPRRPSPRQNQCTPLCGRRTSSRTPRRTSPSPPIYLGRRRALLRRSRDYHRRSSARTASPSSSWRSTSIISATSGRFKPSTTIGGGHPELVLF